MPDDASFRPRVAAMGARLTSVGRRVWFIAAGGVVVLVLGALALNWFLVGRYLVATDNAYVRADISLISAQVEGYVRTVPVSDNQPVHAGDVLVEIDPAEYQAHVAAAQGALAQAQGARAQQLAQRAWAASQVARYRPLARRGILSPAGMQQVEVEASQAGSGLASADAAVQAAQAQLEAAQLDLGRTIVRAPINGVIGDRQVQVGQLVRSGSPMMSVVPLQSVYVVANFKETQIADLHAGQPVTIAVDASHSLRLRGEVQSLAPASGTQFSIIPTDTATGNFTKIVQRIPVRIRIPPGQAGAELLRPGLSVTATVDTRE